jgi:hypothetical protein
MNRPVLIIAIAIAVLVLGALLAMWLFLAPKAPSPSGSNVNGIIDVNDPNYVPYPSGGSQGSATNSSPEAAAVQSAFAAKLASGGNPDNIRMENTVVAGEYALQLWSGDIMSGEALLKYDATQRQWAVVDLGGGAWTAESLVSIGGVPENIAASLVAGAARR